MDQWCLALKVHAAAGGGGVTVWELSFVYFLPDNASCYKTLDTLPDFWDESTQNLLFLEDMSNIVTSSSLLTRSIIQSGHY